ncbi:TonB-dependent receptor, partial [Pseudomonas aeruginosa]|uniref:TonB-dependent receptor domain-containing protein n=1 Tax=Pseudomonas aeruginosa TaxID=287 RepID=UPI0031B76F09
APTEGKQWELGLKFQAPGSNSFYTDDDWEKFTGRIGALYLFDNGLAPYVSYSESFNPNAYSDASGTPLAPTEGKQWELGLKFQAPGSNSFYTASLFHITHDHV